MLICGLSFIWKAVHGVSSAEYRFHLVCRRSFMLCIVGRMEQDVENRDGVNVLWCRSHLVWLVFEGSVPTCACFHLENFFVTCSCCFFCCCCQF